MNKLFKNFINKKINLSINLRKFLDKLLVHFLDFIKKKHIRAEIINAIAEARSESLKEVYERFSDLELRLAPSMGGFIKHMPLLRKIDFEDTGLIGNIAYAKINDGNIYYGFKSKPNQVKQFKYVKDLISPRIKAETFGVAQDVCKRIISDIVLPPKQIFPPKNGVIVECGAYLGHKTIRFAQELVPEGKVLAIELMPKNIEILKKNIVENNLKSRIDVKQSGVWNKNGYMEVKGKGYQRNTLVNLDKLSDKTGIKARVQTLDDILQEWGVPYIDILFITVNGAEVEALQGLNKWFSKIGIIWLVSPYKRNGLNNSDICREILLNNGCKILSLGDSTSKSRRDRVFARQIFAKPIR